MLHFSISAFRRRIRSKFSSRFKSEQYETLALPPQDLSSSGFATKPHSQRDLQRRKERGEFRHITHRVVTAPPPPKAARRRSTLAGDKRLSVLSTTTTGGNKRHSVMSTGSKRSSATFYTSRTSASPLNTSPTSPFSDSPVSPADTFASSPLSTTSTYASTVTPSGSPVEGVNARRTTSRTLSDESRKRHRLSVGSDVYLTNQRRLSTLPFPM
ncbi:hypothetical protein K402DRAFT_461538 [Aulographum hederae CBS 113979]|uniref:Uncharacterized protein n=1 Tax=Aulographum hederae CBS 113979 TaxID=1176131 RepID=A0A6G1H7J9_9PEZI|nr:hypothetical protein K402DRAFT_461538 [Aulographum hederae CBS 113979]